MKKILSLMTTIVIMSAVVLGVFNSPTALAVKRAECSTYSHALLTADDDGEWDSDEYDYITLFPVGDYKGGTLAVQIRGYDSDGNDAYLYDGDVREITFDKTANELTITRYGYTTHNNYDRIYGMPYTQQLSTGEYTFFSEEKFFDDMFNTEFVVNIFVIPDELETVNGYYLITDDMLCKDKIKVTLITDNGAYDRQTDEPLKKSDDFTTSVTNSNGEVHIVYEYDGKSLVITTKKRS